ncbi:MAG: hypothetical protein HC849_33060 [Oscillatoriales cyanobacterium RU_3_3]|nr:hypothetical protein [Microcoleus sp. SU_5_6]NJL66196.1 hypothetical protein [Microcoleus sp. SM1_3_4]NJM63883.1 hypothetical protein [Oscillatoriales cyanobacterium RU_3_3]
MDTDLFRKIAQTLKEQFPKANDEFLMQQAREMYETEMQRRSTLSDSERFRERLDDKMRRKFL